MRSEERGNMVRRTEERKVEMGRGKIELKGMEKKGKGRWSVEDLSALLKGLEGIVCQCPS
jgi:hypothetical protein